MSTIKRIFAFTIMFITIIGFNSFNVMAGEWQYSIQYRRDNGSYLKNQWLYDNGQWYYFNNDNLLEIATWIEKNGLYYYVGANGSMYANEITPDGYYVGEDGSWDGKAPIQTSSVTLEQAKKVIKDYYNFPNEYGGDIQFLNDKDSDKSKYDFWLYTDSDDGVSTSSYAIVYVDVNTGSLYGASTWDEEKVLVKK